MGAIARVSRVLQEALTSVNGAELVTDALTACGSGQVNIGDWSEDGTLSLSAGPAGFGVNPDQAVKLRIDARTGELR